jgi:hypothetical protein
MNSAFVSDHLDACLEFHRAICDFEATTVHKMLRPAVEPVASFHDTLIAGTHYQHGDENEHVLEAPLLAYFLRCKRVSHCCRPDRSSRADVDLEQNGRMARWRNRQFGRRCSCRRNGPAWSQRKTLLNDTRPADGARRGCSRYVCCARCASGWIFAQLLLWFIRRRALYGRLIARVHCPLSQHHFRKDFCDRFEKPLQSLIRRKVFRASEPK